MLLVWGNVVGYHCVDWCCVPCYALFSVVSDCRCGSCQLLSMWACGVVECCKIIRFEVIKVWVGWICVESVIDVFIMELFSFEVLGIVL